ncbi:MAG: transporter substrate-binding domain-containing protein [Vicinamibacteria bacterium]
MRWRGLAAMAVLLSAAPARADLAEVKERGTLRVMIVLASKTGDEFFNQSKTGSPGFDREILEGFASLQRVKIEVVPVASWDALVPALLSGKGDVIAGRVTVTESRRKLVDFTGEVFPTRHVVFTREPHRVVTTVAELREEKVGTVRGTSMAEVIAQAGVPAARVDDGIPTGTLPQALKAGRVTAAVLGVENVMAAQRRDPALQLGLFLGPPGSLAYGVRKGEPELLKALGEYVENFRRSPAWNRLVVKYLGEKAPEILRRARTE